MFIFSQAEIQRRSRLRNPSLDKRGGMVRQKGIRPLDRADPFGESVMDRPEVDQCQIPLQPIRPVFRSDKASVSKPDRIDITTEHPDHTPVSKPLRDPAPIALGILHLEDPLRRSTRDRGRFPHWQQSGTQPITRCPFDHPINVIEVTLIRLERITLDKRRLKPPSHQSASATSKNSSTTPAP